VKLWHDDTRYPPEGWVWAQTNEAARLYLSKDVYEEISMDHDMGAKPGEIWAAGSNEDNGTVLAQWMVETGNVPLKITIHSWNPISAKRMAGIFNDAGYDVILDPFVIPESGPNRDAVNVFLLHPAPDFEA
jgi:hypothetical protein